MSGVWQNVHRKGKTKEKYVWLFVYLPMCFDFNLFLNAIMFYWNYFSMRNNYDR